ncbi:hypothetical protein [Glycomyces terrestris]|uniref:Uncharacterized protein n=1 Tax=Glycomyces terrestris TaxID=2493553 RepID=A0A426USW8_9ACTN|nr:hypothetical protein [Glycomyces terrestris]RRR96820.1 hypothetical protein EIW28_20450 [Glycomyces terrestris]
MAPVDRETVERELADRLAERDLIGARLLDCESRAAFAALRAEAAAVPAGRCAAALRDWDLLWNLFHAWSEHLAATAALRGRKGRLTDPARAAAMLARFTDPEAPDALARSPIATERALGLMEDRYGRVAALVDEIEVAIDASGLADPLADRIDALEDRERRLLTRWNEARERISDPPLAKPARVSATLRADLDRLPVFGEAGWTEAAAARARLTRRVEAAEHRVEADFAACNEPLNRRNRLRSEAEAYRARAERLGRGADPAVRDAWTRARAVLWTAPCSLPEARKAVDELAASVNGDRT